MWIPPYRYGANYGNHDAVGEAIRELGMRSEVFLVSKLKAETKSYEGALAEFEQTLEELGTDYLDLYLIHAPWPWSNVGEDCTEGNIEAWRALISLYEAGRIRSIGVSNFHPEHIEALVRATGFVPHVNQFRFFIGNTQERIWSYGREKGILGEAYSPLATGKLMNHPVIQQLSAKYGVSAPQLCIRYCVERGMLPVIKSVHRERMLANLELDFTIGEEDVRSLSDIEIPQELKRKLRS